MVQLHISKKKNEVDGEPALSETFLNYFTNPIAAEGSELNRFSLPVTTETKELTSDMWKYKGNQRPEFAIEPKPGQESVWDYPRPPELVSDHRKIEVFSEDDVLIARASSSIRVLETASPPTFYIAPDDLLLDLTSCDGASYCEWKGQASYFSYGNVKIAWRYDGPSESFKQIDGWYSFYASLTRCFVDSERVQAQRGDFYGGWITQEVVGPFKGDPGTLGW